MTTPIEEPIERETIGWLTKQDQEILLIKHDRTTQNQQLQSKHESGLIILKSCILEMRQLPLKSDLELNLNSQKTKDKAEYALQKTKRKTLQKSSSRKGATI